MDQGFVQQKGFDVSIQQQADKTHTKKKQQQLHFEIKHWKLNEKKSAICLWLEVRDGVTLPNSEEDRLNKRRMS